MRKLRFGINCNISKILLLSVLLTVSLVLSSCNGGQETSAVKATWIQPELQGDTVSIPLNAVKDDKIVHFSVQQAVGGEIDFMAYDLGNNYIVRANVCPPCRSVGFSLTGDTLICDTCKTTFKAGNGEGIAGACVAYPKASVVYTIDNGTMVMKANDLQTAYQNTLSPGFP